MMKYGKGVPKESGQSNPRQRANSAGRRVPAKRAASRKSEPDIPQFVSSRSPEREAARREALIRQTVARRKKRHKKNYILYYILLFLILTVTGIVLSLTVFFNINEITVEGNGSISSQALAEASGIKVGDNLFRINTDRAAKSILAQNINIDTVTVSRKLPSRLAIEVELSETAAVLRHEGQFYSLSQGNRIIRIVEENVDNDIVVVGCDMSGIKLGDYLEGSDQTKLDILTEVLNAIEENSLRENITYIDLTDIAILKIYYDDRVEMKFGGITDISYELGRVKQLVETQISSDEIVSIDATLRNGEYFTRYLQELDLPKEDSAASDGPVTDTPPGDSVSTVSSDGEGDSSSDGPLSSAGGVSSENKNSSDSTASDGVSE